MAGDEAYVDANYANEAPLGPGLMWSQTHRLDSFSLLKERERRTGADVLYGHDSERFECLSDRF
ncbi:hypothetical protein ACNS7O_14365 [Haloferacaceae archaeon DSL9]